VAHQLAGKKSMGNFGKEWHQNCRQGDLGSPVLKEEENEL